MKKPAETSVPFLATAEDMVKSSDIDREFFLYVVPDATEEMLANFELHIIGRIHDGIEARRPLGKDPFGPLEGYKLGYLHGAEDAIQALDKEKEN